MIPIPALVALGSKLLDRAIPDPAARDAAKAELARSAAAGELAELQHVEKMFGLEVEDRKSARDMAKTTGVAPQVILSALFVGGYFAIVLTLLLGYAKVPADLRDLFIGLMSILTAAVTTILAFWFGSSAGSRAKDVHLAKEK